MNQCRCDEAERTRELIHHPRPSDPPPDLPMTERSVDGEVTCAYCWELIGIVWHPNYKNQPSDDVRGALCQCGGIRYWHATVEGGGCEDCDCPEFTPAAAR